MVNVMIGMILIVSKVELVELPIPTRRPFYKRDVLMILDEPNHTAIHNLYNLPLARSYLDYILGSFALLARKT
jgi:hypothetical protein